MPAAAMVDAAHGRASADAQQRRCPNGSAPVRCTFTHRRRPFCAWLTCTCLTTRASTSRPLDSALLSALFSRPSRNSALFLGQRPWPMLLPSL